MVWAKISDGLRTAKTAVANQPLVQTFTQSGSKAALAGGLTVAAGLAAKSNKVQNTLSKFGLQDASSARLALAGLSVGSLIRNLPAANGNDATTAEPPTTDASSTGGLGDDWRVRLTLPPESPILYELLGNTLLEPLRLTRGIVFPVTPQIQITHDAKYSAADLTHTNYQPQFYKNSTVSQIVITCDFPVQSNTDGLYLLAVITMLRAATKMYFGESVLAGNPPPVLRLAGYGSHYFPNVPVVVTNFNHTMPPDADYLRISGEQLGGETVRLPTLSQIIVSVTPVYSRATMSQFNYSDFANGDKLSRDKGFL